MPTSVGGSMWLGQNECSRRWDHNSFILCHNIKLFGLTFSYIQSDPATFSFSLFPLSTVCIQICHTQDVTLCFRHMLLLSAPSLHSLHSALPYTASYLLLQRCAPEPPPALPSEFTGAAITEQASGIDAHLQYSLSVCTEMNIDWIYISRNVDLRQNPWRLSAEFQLRNPYIMLLLQ